MLMRMSLQIGCLHFGRQHGVLICSSIPPCVLCAAWLRGMAASHSAPWLEATKSRVTGWQQPPKLLLKVNTSACCALPLLWRRKNEALPSSVAEMRQEPPEIQAGAAFLYYVRYPWSEQGGDNGAKLLLLCPHQVCQDVGQRASLGCCAC